MAQTWEKFRDAANRAQKIADLLDQARSEARQLIDIHDGVEFAAAADTSPVPAWVKKDDQGNLKGESFGPSDYLAMVAFLRELEKLYTNQTPEAGWYKTRVAAMLTPKQ